MAVRVQAVLGVELQSDEIRVVEVRYQAGVPSVTGSGRAPIPDDARGDATAIGKILDGVVESLRGDAVSEAVFGLPYESVVFRTLVIPPAPDEELPVIVAGEVEHYGLLKSRGASHAYFKLSAPGGVDTSVGVFGAEDDATGFVRSVAAKAGLNVLAVESATYAMCRTACLAARDEATIAAVMIAKTGSEIALLHSEGPLGYRRLDTGAQLLLSKAGAEDGGPLQLQAAASLAIEIRRTLEYFQRQHPRLNTVDRLHLVVDDQSLEALAEYLQDQLAIPVELVRVTVDQTGLPISGGSSGDGHYPNAALGLALWADDEVQALLPPLDLFRRQRSSAIQSESRRNLLISGAVSLAALVLALVGFEAYSSRIQELDTETARAEARAAALSQETNAILVARAKRDAQAKLFRMEGVPLAALMDEIASSVTQGVGLASVTVGNDQRVAVLADATAESPMLATVQRMQLDPLLKNPTIAMYQKNVQKNGITFQVSAQTYPLSNVKSSTTGAAR